jgi:2-desacetyl-2-hydroxyethyl bacteriochlorophyllide A dehydrogenase
MKAAIIEEAGKLVVREISKPAVGDYDVLCETQYGAVCTGTDTHLVNFHPPFCYWIGLPAILGHESIGKVVELGAKVRNLKVGDLVTRVGHPGADGVGSAWGGFAEYALGKDWQAMKADGVEGWQGHTVNRVLPEGVDAADGTMFITWRETLSYMTRIGAHEAKSVLVLGSGSNGLAMANHAVNLGAVTVVLVGSAAREVAAEKIGCTGFVDYKAEDAKEQVLAYAPDGFDVVVDVIGTPANVDMGLSCIANNGTIGIYGLDDAGAVVLSPALAGRKTFTLYQGGYDEGETHDQVCAFVKAGKLDASIWIDKRKAFTLEEIGKAFGAVQARTLVKPLVRIAVDE